MRWYRLTINDNIVFQSNKVYPRYYNPTPLNIEFEVQSFAQSGTLSTTCGIKLYIQSLSALAQLRSLEGKPIKLEAGWDYESGLAKHLDYVSVNNNVIFRGSIAGVTANFGAGTNESYLYITNAMFKPPSDVSYKLKITQNDKMFNTSKSQTGSSEDICTTLYQALTLTLGENVKLSVSDSIKDLQWTKKNDYANTFTSFNDLQNIFAKDFKVGLAYSSTNNTVIAYNLNTEKKTKKVNGKEVRDKEAEKLEQQKEIMNTMNSTTSKRIYLAEILSQPIFQGFNTGISLVTALRPDITIGSKISLGWQTSEKKTSILSGVSSTTSSMKSVIPAMGGSFGTDQQYIDSTANKIPLTIKGEFVPTKVTHKGSFYGSGPDSWATTMECIRA